ncbi:MAG: hypothetical protein GC147_13370 [Porphyrobacter sp.]|nr:hypothetical protein [Porphyrobacter sp.]
MRVVEIDGQPWFVGADVVRVLGFSKKSTATAYRHLADDESRYSPRETVGMGHGRAVRLLTESGLYKLIMRSDKPEARDRAPAF